MTGLAGASHRAATLVLLQLDNLLEQVALSAQLQAHCFQLLGHHWRHFLFLLIGAHLDQFH